MIAARYSYLCPFLRTALSYIPTLKERHRAREKQTARMPRGRGDVSRDDDGEYNEHDEEEQEAQEIGAAPVLLHATPDGSLQLTVPARRPVVRARHEVLDLVDVLLLRADERGDVAVDHVHGRDLGREALDLLGALALELRRVRVLGVDLQLDLAGAGRARRAGRGPFAGRGVGALEALEGPQRRP